MNGGVKGLKGMHGITVLHVDDEPFLGEITKMSLEKGGEFSVDLAHSGAEALEKIKTGSYSCVISDYEMPYMNGIELLEQVRAFDTEIPFIIFSGRGRERLTIDALNTGADFVIQKGGDPKSLFAELNHKVKYAIEQRNARLALKRRDAILEAISLVANLFLDGHTFEKALQEAITLIGLSTEVDRVLIFKNLGIDTDALRVQKRHEWARIPDGFQEISRRDLAILFSDLGPAWKSRMEKGEPILLPVSEEETADAFCTRFQIRSTAIFPVYVEKTWWGMIWFCDCLSSRRWAEVELDALGTASAMIGSAISHDRMKADLIRSRELSESMYSMMRHLCDAVPDLLWAKDLDGKYLFVNKPEADLLLGRSDTAAPIGKTFDYYQKQEQSNHPDDESWFTLEDNAAYTDTVVAETRLPDKFELRGTVRGQSKWYDLTKVPFYDHTGSLIGTVGIGREVSSAKEAEMRIREEKIKYSSIFHSLHIGLILCSPDGIITEVNKRAVVLLGYPRSVLKHSCISTYLPLQMKEIISSQSEPPEGDPVLTGKNDYVDPAGNARSLYYSVLPQKNENGDIIEYLVILDEHYRS